MFTNITMFRSKGGNVLLPSAPHFLPCEPTQAHAIGFVGPRTSVSEGEPINLIETVAGHKIMAVMIESKRVPAEAVQRRLDELVVAFEESNCRKPGRMERRDLKDQATHELMPHAFAKRIRVPVWLSPDGLLVVGSASGSVVDGVISLLVANIPGIEVISLNTVTSPRAAMAHWLSCGDPPEDITVDRECELKSDDEMKSTVRYGRHPLDTDEVRMHISHGKLPTKLAMTWRGRVSFVLDGEMHLRRISLLDGVMDGNDDLADRFDADAAIITAELLGLISGLIEAMGGEPSKRGQ